MKLEKEDKEKFQDQEKVVRQLMATLSESIEKFDILKDMNFGLFYQHGRVAFVDLDVFAKNTTAKLKEKDETKTLTELTEEIDKDSN